VLVVDESAERTETLRAALLQAGYQVTASLSSSLTLLRTIEQQQPDVIVIDTDSPSRDVLEHRTSSSSPSAASRLPHVAVFRIQEKIYAVGNHDPISGANVLSRGIVGDLKGELVVASPIYKQHFSLLTGRCVEDASVRIPVYDAKVEEGVVIVEPVASMASS
jgi:NAD(P)H-dependent nitrite reductase small subunit